MTTALVFPLNWLGVLPDHFFKLFILFVGFPFIYTALFALSVYKGWYLPFIDGFIQFHPAGRLSKTLRNRGMALRLEIFRRYVMKDDGTVRINGWLLAAELRPQLLKDAHAHYRDLFESAKPAPKP